MERRIFLKMLSFSVLSASTAGCTSFLSRLSGGTSEEEGTSFVDTRAGTVKLPNGTISDSIDDYNDALDKVCQHYFGRHRVEFVAVAAVKIRMNKIEVDFRCPECKVGMLDDGGVLEDVFIPPEDGDGSGGRGWFDVYGKCGHCGHRGPIKGARQAARPLAMVGDEGIMKYDQEVGKMVIPLLPSGWIIPRPLGVRLPELPTVRVPLEPILAP